MSTTVSEHLNTILAPDAPLPPPGIGEKVLIGALAALIVARPLIHGDDPGHLRLTSSAGATWFDLAVWFLLMIFAAWRVIPHWNNRKRVKTWIDLLPIPIAILLTLPTVESYRYADENARWVLVTLFPIFYLTKQLASRPDDRRGLVNMFVASAVSIAAMGVIQRFGPYLGIPSMEVQITDVQSGLVGDDEFQSQLNARLCPTGPVHGTLESPESYLIYLLAFLPLTMLLSKQAGPKSKILLPIFVILGILSAFAGRIFDNQVQTSFREGIRLLLSSNSIFGSGGAGFARNAQDGSLASGSAWLTMMTTFGFLWALLPLFVFYSSVKLILDFKKIPLVSEPEEFKTTTSTRWEFFLGGIAGLLGGFIASVGQMPAEAPVREIYNVGGFAITRGFVWLAAFAILEKLRPEPPALRLGVLLAIVMIALSGFFSEATGSMAILFSLPMLIAIWYSSEMRFGIVNNESSLTTARSVLGLVFSATVFGYFAIMIAGPAIQTSNAVRKARTASRFYPEIERQIGLAKNPVETANSRTRAVNFLRGQIIQPLRQASHNEPSNAALLLEVARWERTLWRQLLHVDPGEAAKLGKEILKSADKAANLDPKNIAGEQSVLEALLLYRQESNARPTERLEAFNNHLQKVTKKAPELEVPYRYRMLSALLAAKDIAGIESELVTLLRLNRVEGTPHGRMTENQLQEIVDRSRGIIVNPPKELLDEWTK